MYDADARDDAAISDASSVWLSCDAVLLNDLMDELNVCIDVKMKMKQNTKVRLVFYSKPINQTFLEFRLDYRNFRLISRLATFTRKVENAAKCLNYG